MIGNKFNKWLVLEEVDKNKWGTRVYKCRCDCGIESYIARPDLISNASSQCIKCKYIFKKEIKKIRYTFNGNNYKHGYNRTPTYRSWQLMKTRCNPNTNSYYSKRTFKWYGAKGVKVCERWINSFQNFLEDMGEKQKGMQLDRIDSNGNYEPSNCRWVTPLQNNHNRSYVKKRRDAKLLERDCLNKENK